MKLSVFITVAFFFLSCKHPRQNTHDAYVKTDTHAIAAEFLNSLESDLHKKVIRDFEDERRTTWDRIPMKREGLKMTDLTKAQKRLLHELIKSCMSREGYLLVTAIMFNEDVQKKFEPELGKNEYWIEIFGIPRSSKYWGWQLEGHHLSLNFTFDGENMISNTPFLIGGNPQIIDSDDERNGLTIIYEEELLASELVATFFDLQKEKGYAEGGQPNNMYGEIYRDSIYTPFEGLQKQEMNAQQQVFLESLLQSYADYFTFDTFTHLAEKRNTSFYFIGTPTFDGKHYYGIKNESVLIECENYRNHTHHLIRTENDFGLRQLQY